MYCANNPIRWIDKDGRSFGVPIPIPYLLPPPVVSGSKEMSATEQYHALGQALIDLPGELIKFTENYNQTVGVIGATIILKSLSDLGLLEATAPDPNGFKEQKRREDRSRKEDVKHRETNDKISDGGHNPKIPDGDFRPNFDPEKVGTAVKIIAVGTATGIAASQIGGENDARKDIQENDKQPNKADRVVTGNYLIDILHYLFSEK